MLPWVAVGTLSSVFQSFVKCVLSFLKFGVCLVSYYYMSELEVPCLAFAPLIDTHTHAHTYIYAHTHTHTVIVGLVVLSAGRQL